jgi:fibronectin-binding autotransporter adhesin
MFARRWFGYHRDLTKLPGGGSGVGNPTLTVPTPLIILNPLFMYTPPSTNLKTPRLAPNFIKRLSSWLVLSTSLTVVVARTLTLDAEAASVYWDINGNIAGASATGAAIGTWNSGGGANAFWNDSFGTGTTAAWTSGDIAVFAAGGNATNSYTVNVDGTQEIGGVAFEEGTVTLAGGTLQMTTNSAFDVAANLTATVNSTIDGGFDITKTGSGILVLGGANSYTGRTVINAGTLSIATDANLGAVPGVGTVDSITFGGSSTLQITGTANPTIASNRGITIGNTFTATVQVVASANTVTYGGVVTGAAGTTLKKTGAGTLDFQGDSTAAMLGALNIDGGTLKLSGNGALAGTSGVTLGNRATLTLDNSGTNLADRTAGAFTSTGGTINFIGNAAATTETLGALTLSPGALTINSTVGAGGNTLTIPSITRSAGGTLMVSGSNIGAASNQIILTSVTGLPASGAVIPWAIVIDGTGAGTAFAIHSGAGTSLSRLGTHNSGAMSTWVAASNARPTTDASNNVAVSVNTITLDDTIDILGTPLTADRNITLSGAGGGAVLQTGGVSTVTANGTSGYKWVFGANEAIFHVLGALSINRGSDDVYNGSSGTSATFTGTGGFTKTGAGTLTLNAESAITGTYRVNEGVLELLRGSALNGTAQAVHLNGGTLRLTQAAGTGTATTFTGNLTVNADSSVTISRVDNPATATTHTMGTLSIGGGRTLSVNALNITAGTAYGLTFSGALTLTGPATLDVANNGAGLGTLTVSTVGGAFPLTKSGAGDLTLSNVAGVYSGLVDIQGGRVGWSLGSGTLTESSLFSGAGGLHKTGNGAINLTAANTFTGPIMVTLGTLGFSTVSNNGGSASNLGQGTDGLILNGGTLNFMGGTSQSTNRGITLIAGSILNAAGTGGATITYSGPIATAANTLTLTGTAGGFITGGITQTGGSADLAVNSGTWSFSGTPSSLTDDFINTGSTVVINLNSTGVITWGAGASTGPYLYLRAGATVNFNANDPLTFLSTGILIIGDASGATVINTLNMNAFNQTVPRLDLGSVTTGYEGLINGTGTLTVTGATAGTGFNLNRGVINANLAGAGAVFKQGLTHVTLKGDNSGLSGTTATRIDAGNLILDYTVSNTSKINVGGALDMRGGALVLNGHNTLNTSQTVASFTLASGGSNRISLNSGASASVTLNLGAITRANGTGTVRFELPVSGSATTTTANHATTGLLGTTGTAFATVTDATGTYFAKNDGAGNIVGLTYAAAKNDVSTWSAADHITDETTGFTGSTNGTVGINSLRFNAAGLSTATILAGNALGIASGGVLQTGNVTAGTGTLSGGRVVSGTGELVFQMDSGSQILNVGSVITGAHTLTKTGSGILRLSGNNDYTGATSILAGTLRVSGGNGIGDTSLVTLADDQPSTLQLLNDETIGRLAGGNLASVSGTAVGVVDVGTSALTINNSASTDYYGVFTGSGSIVKNGSGNLQILAPSPGFTGAITVNQSLFYFTTAGTTAATAITVNKGGVLMMNKNGTTAPAIDQIPDLTPITLNSADGLFSGGTIVYGLTIRNDQGNTRTENVGAITVNSGASYATVQGTATSAITALISDNILRSNNATLDVRGVNMQNTSNQRGQWRIGNTGNQTTFINAMVGGAGAAGTKTVSIVPWAIAENTTAAIGDTSMGNSLATYASGQGFRALDFTTEYNTYTASAVATENIRESLAANLASLPGKTINSLVLHDSTTAAGTLTVTGTSGNALTITSGAMLFTLNSAATNSTAHNIILGGFDSGITTAGTNPEYVLHVVNPSSLSTTATLTTTIGSPLTSTADITKSGRGTLILSGTNTAGGGSKKTTINEGVLQIADMDNLGGNTGGLVFAGGTLRLGAGFTDTNLTRTITFLQSGGTLDTNGIDVALTSSLGSGPGPLTKIGGGTLTLNSTAALTGSTTLSAGNITLGASDAIGAGDLSIAAGSTLAMGAFNATVGNITLPNSATVALTGTGTLTGSGTMTASRATISPLLAGSMNLIKQTAAVTLTLSNPANTYTGYTHVQDGTLSIASVANAGVASSLGAPTGDNAAIRLGNLATAGTLAYTGGLGSTDRMIVLAGTTGGATIDGSGTGALTLAGDITGTEYGTKILTLTGTPTTVTNVVSGDISNGLGTLGVTKSGAGLWWLTGANTYTGATNLSAGILVISDNSNLGSTTGTIAPVTFNGGTLRYAPAATNTDVSGRTVAFTAGAIIDTNGNNVTYANGIGGTAAFGLTKTGAGTLTLAGANTFTGTSNVSGGTLQIGNGSTGSIALGAGNLLVANTAGNAVLNIVTGGTTTVNMLQVGSVSGASGAVNLSGGSLTMTQAETGPDSFQSFGAATGSYGAFAMSAGTLTTTRFMFGGTNAAGSSGIGVGLISGGIVNTTGYLLIARNGTSTGILTITGGTINHTGATQHIYLGLAGSGRAELNVNGGLINNTGRGILFSGGGFSWTGTGILNLNAGTLTTDNIVHSSGTSYVSFNGGALRASAGSAAFVPTTITAAYVNGAFGAFAGGAVVDSNMFDITIAEPLLAPAGNGVFSLAVATEGAGYIGAPAVLISGTGTGATAIANMVDDGSGNGTFKVGSITITNPGVNYTGTPTFTLSGGGAATAATAGAVATALNTSGGLTKLGAGILTLSGTNTFGGPVNVNGGTLAFSTSANLGAATQVTNTLGANGATLSYTGATSLDLGANRVLTVGSGGATLDVGAAAATLTFSGGVAPASTGNLVKTGAGAVILSGATDLNGGTTTVSGGFLRASFGTDGTSAISVAAGAVLHNMTPSASTLVLPNTGSVTFAAGASLATASNLGFGLNASTAAGITLSSGGALTINGSGTVFLDLLSLGTPLSPTTYTLLNAPDGGLLTGTGGAVSYALDDVVGGYTYTLNLDPTFVSVTVGLFSGSVFWHGDLTGPAGSWTDYRFGDTNWLNAASGGTDEGIIPGAQTTVVFSAMEATGPAISTTLDGDVTIKHLQFTSNPVGVTSVTIAQGTAGALTIAPGLSTNGIDVGDNAGAITISAPFVAGTDQTWNVSGTGTPSLTVSGGLTGSGDITKTGAGALTIGGANSTYNGDFIWSGGALTITPTGTGANNLVFNGVISGSGSGPLLKNGTGILVLNGANTYSGGTTLDGGTTILGNKQAFGAGTVNTLTNTPTLLASVDLSGANKIANAFVLDSNLTVSGANSLEIGGTTTTSTNNRTLTNNLTGPAVLTLTGNVILGETGFARNLTVNGSGGTVINGIVGNGGAGGAWLVKGGTGTLTLGAANTYTGFTIVDQGSMILAPGVNQSMTNTFYFGSSAGASTAGTLDLSNASATFTVTGTNLAFWNQINSTTNTPSIVIGAGQSLNLNGNVLIGNNSGASTTTLMTASGLGTINVTNAATNASFRVGGYSGSTTNAGNRASADLSGLAVLNITLNTTNGTVAVSNSGTVNTAGIFSTLILPGTTTITAKTLVVGDGGQNTGAGQVNSLKLGSVANNFNVDTLNIGTGNRDLGSIIFNTATGTINVHAVAGATSRTAFNMAAAGGGTGVTGASGNTFDVSGHTATLMLGAVVIGTQNRGIASVNTLSFDQGTMDMTSLTLSTRSANSSTGAGPFSTTTTVNFGGGDVDIQNGILQAGQVTGGTNAHSVTATINISGAGTVDVGNTAGTSIQMASSATSTGTATATLDVSGGTTTLTGGMTMATATTAGGSATGSVNITGGTLTVGGNISRGGGAGTTSATVTLNGGTLDMTDGSIGAATAGNTISFNAQQGTLKNLDNLNGGGTLTKTTAGALNIEGVNDFAGLTDVTAGKVVVSGSLAGDVAVTAGAELDSGNNLTSQVAAITAASAALSNAVVSVGGHGDGVGLTTVGRLNVTGNVTLGSGMIGSDQTVKLRLEIGGDDRGTEYDQIQLAATTQLTLANADLVLTTANSFNPTTLAIASPGNHDGSLLFLFEGSTLTVSGTFQNAGAADPDQLGFGTYTVGGQLFAISYEANFNGGIGSAFTGGTDVALMAIPEPNSLAMLAGSLSLALGLQRFRRQNRRKIG